MKKIIYVLFLFVSFSSFLQIYAQHNIQIRMGAQCVNLGTTVFTNYSSITEGTLYSIGDWTLPANYQLVQPLYDALKGSTFQIETGALTEDIRVDWILWNMNCSNGGYLPNGTLSQTVFSSYFIVYHNVGGTWTAVEPYNFVTGKNAILKLKNTLAFQTLCTSLGVDPSLVAFVFYTSAPPAGFNFTGITTTPPSPLTDTSKFWIISAAHFSNIVGGNKTQMATGINDRNNSIPDAFNLAQNYPNPFNPSTIIEYSLPERANVELNVFNILGVKVATLVKSAKEAGTYKVEFNGSNLSSGLYFYELKTNKFTLSRKMMLLK